MRKVKMLSDGSVRFVDIPCNFPTHLTAFGHHFFRTLLFFTNSKFPFWNAFSVIPICTHILYKNSRREVSEINTWFVQKPISVQIDELYATVCSNFSWLKIWSEIFFLIEAASSDVQSIQDSATLSMSYFTAVNFE